MSALVAAAQRVLAPQTAAWVERATELSRFAGPDGDAVQLGDCWALGSALLRTAPYDVAAPQSLDGRTWVSADARLDDRSGLIGTVRAHGLLAHDPSDAELILHAYRLYGQSFLDHLAGEFAFVLWDADLRKLTAATDQLGTTPLYYAPTRAGLLLASAIETLLLHPDVSDELDEPWIADFLLRGGVPQDLGSSIYSAIRRVPAGHVLEWHDGHVELRRYWTFPEHVPLIRFQRPEQYGERCRELLDAAVADRITSDRVGTQLSGGMDSGSIAVSAAAILAGRGAPPSAVRAVTGVLGGITGDHEGDFSRLVAEFAGLSHEILDASLLAVNDPLAAPVIRTGEPRPFQRTTLALDLVRVLAAHSSVGLSGVGGDSLLWVSPWYWAGWLARGDVVRLWHAVQDQRRLFGDRLHPRLRRGLRRLITPPYSGRAPLPDWLSPAFAERTAAAQRTFGYRAHAAGFDARSLATDPFWSTMCQWGDPVSTRQAIKFRYPLLDLRLIEFVRGLPPEPWLRDKHVLREATVNRLPDVVRHRPKELLVNAPMPGQTEASPGRLIELLRQAPDLDCYIDIDAIVAHVTALGPVVDQASDQRLATTIGLAHWLTYR